MADEFPEPITPPRIALSKKARFEVLKRDKFSCQYCGAKAPDALLHVDHVVPVVEGGGNDMLNLVSACAACNGGKGARRLSDHSAMEKQREKIADLEERRQQIEMMAEWRDELLNSEALTVGIIANRICANTGIPPNERGLDDIRKWLTRHSADAVMAALDIAFSSYGQTKNGEMTPESWNIAFRKVPGIIDVAAKAKEKPWLPRLFYIQGILRNRCSDRRMRCVDALEEMVGEGVPPEVLDTLARRVSTWSEMIAEVDHWLATRPGRA